LDNFTRLGDISQGFLKFSEICFIVTKGAEIFSLGFLSPKYEKFKNAVISTS
jgi:hypothetical protein